MEDQRTRNTGIVPVKATAALKGKTVAVAGVGGSGGSIIELLVQQYQLAGVKIADLDTVDRSNLNRQNCARHSTLGLPKVKVVAAQLRDIDPELSIVEFDRGVQPDNLEEFLDGVDFVVDAVDFKRAEIHLALARRARELGIPLLIGIEIGYGARVVWFEPGGTTFEEFFGLTPASKHIGLRPMIMRLPSYIDTRAFQKINDSARAVAEAEARGEKLEPAIEAPAIATGGACVAGLAAPIIEAILTDTGRPAPAPAGHWVDTKEVRRKGGVIRRRQLVWLASLLVAALRTKLGRNHSAL